MLASSTTESTHAENYNAVAKNMMMMIIIIIIIIINRCSNSQESQPSQHHHREAPEVYRLERRAYKDMATENGPHNTTSTTHNRYYPK
jgi:hypothetical protein